MDIIGDDRVLGVFRNDESTNVPTVVLQVSDAYSVFVVAFSDLHAERKEFCDDSNVIRRSDIIPLSAVLPVIQNDITFARHVVVILNPNAHLLGKFYHLRATAFCRNDIRIAKLHSKVGNESGAPCVRVLDLVASRKRRLAVVLVDDGFVTCGTFFDSDLRQSKVHDCLS